MKDIAINGFYFISHSSKDLDKVRKIRNVIEEEKGNPILFYLKCLEQDNPVGKDNLELKSLISREIMARQKFILCKSKYTEVPLCSEWIEWEKQEVRRMALNKAKVQFYEIDIDNNENYIEEVRSIVLKQRKVLLAGPFGFESECSLLKEYLISRQMDVQLVNEDFDMRNEITRYFGCHTKDLVKEYLRQFSIEDKGIVVILDSECNRVKTFVQMVDSMSRHNKNFVVHFQIPVVLQTADMDRLYRELSDLMRS